MNKKEKFPTAFSAVPIADMPENVSELINKYGTYEIQPTADTENKYPTIAQGLAKKQKKAEKHQRS
ncbi:MAG: hypothetical protein IJ946_02510 [Clostridia bacterium]|nr:hypothetical protein [Clostridia bacterium]